MSARYRTQGLTSPANRRIDYRRYLTCPETSWVDYGGVIPVPSVGVTKTMFDYVIPNYRKRAAKGEVFFNDMSKVETESNEGSGVGRHTIATYNTCTNPVLKVEYKCDDNMFPGYLSGDGKVIPVEDVISYSDINSLQTEVSTKCLANREVSNSELFESVAQYGQTLEMLRHPINQFFRFVKKNGKRIRKLNPAGAYLAARYGLKPLVSDIVGILEGMEGPRGIKRKTTRAKGEMSKSSISSGVIHLPVMDIYYLRNTSDYVSCRAMSLDEYLATVGSNIGFTMSGLVSLPWELVPYSFVVDWFVNVEDYIRSHIPLPSFNQLGSCLVTRRQQQTTYSVLNTVNLQPANWNIVRPMSGTCSAVRNTTTRIRLTEPGLVLKADFRLDNVTRIADALAMCRQLSNGMILRR